MVGCTILAGVLFVGVLGWLAWRNRLACRLLADRHLIETALALEKVKQAALRQPIASAAAFAPLPHDPRVLSTSKGLLVFWTVSPFEGQYAHHLSLSVTGGYVPRRAGQTLLLYLAGLLGVAHQRLHLSVSRSTVQHAEFLLDETEQQELARHKVQAPALAKLPALRKTWSLASEAVRWDQIGAGRKQA